MTCGLRDRISFCAAGGRHFFLDRSANRYFALREKDEALFSRLIVGAIDPARIESLSPALAPLLASQSNIPLTPFALDEMPHCDVDWRGARVRPILVMRALLAYGLIKVKLARHTLAQLFDAFDRARPASRALQQPEARLAELGRAFELVRAWTGEDQCLPLSLGFAQLAYGMGYRVRIVFAITPRPFGAHCWVQLGPRILNDQLSRVEAFTPIYAI